MEETIEQDPLSEDFVLPEPIPNSDRRKAPGSTPNCGSPPGISAIAPGTKPFPGRKGRKKFASQRVSYVLTRFKAPSGIQKRKRLASNQSWQRRGERGVQEGDISSPK